MNSRPQQMFAGFLLAAIPFVGVHMRYQGGGRFNDGRAQGVLNATTKVVSPSAGKHTLRISLV